MQLTVSEPGVAPQEGQLEAARALLDAAAAVELRAANGATALSVAEANGHADLAALLRQYGAE